MISMACKDLGGKFSSFAGAERAHFIMKAGCFELAWLWQACWIKIRRYDDLFEGIFEGLLCCLDPFYRDGSIRWPLD